MINDLIPLAPYFAALIVLAAVLIWLNERAECHSWDVEEAAEQAARVRANMPLNHPEHLTTMLAPADELWLKKVAEGLGLEAAG